MINDAELRRFFPVADRTRLKVRRLMSLHCNAPFLSYVDFMGVAAEKPKEIGFEDLSLKDKCAFFNVIDSSNLELDPNVMHPFVKIHIVNMLTGNYVQKSRNLPSVAYYETITTFQKNDKSFEINACDILIPFATKCFDLRESGNSRAIWNEGFLNYYMNIFVIFVKKII